MPTSELDARLAQLEHADLVRPLAEPDPAYLFKHALTQETAYQTLLLRTRRAIHRRLALFYEQQYADDLDAHALELARHYTSAGETAQATSYYRRAGAWSRGLGSLTEAREAFEHALELTPQDQTRERAELMVEIGTLHARQGGYREGQQWLDRALGLSEASGDAGLAGAALSELAYIAVNQGDYPLARQAASDALTRARGVGDRSTAARASRMIGIVAGYEGDLDRAREHCGEALQLYRELDDRQGVNQCLNSMGVFAINQSRWNEATRYLEEALALSRALGDRYAMCIRLTNLGTVAAAQKQAEPARRYYTEALKIARELDSREDIGTIQLNLGDVAAGEGDALTAEALYREALAQGLSIGAQPLALSALVGLAGLRATPEQAACAAELLGLVLNHPAFNAELREYAEPTLAALRALLSPEELQAALERGRGFSFEQVAEQERT